MDDLQIIKNQLAAFSQSPPSYWHFDVAVNLLCNIVAVLPEETRALELAGLQEPGSVLTPFLVRQFQLSGIATLDDLCTKSPTLSRIPSLGIKKTLLLCELLIAKFGGKQSDSETSLTATNPEQTVGAACSEKPAVRRSAFDNRQQLKERLVAIREELRAIEYGSPRLANQVVKGLFAEIVSFLPEEMKSHAPEQIPWSIPWACLSQNWRSRGIDTIGGLAGAGSRLIDASGVGKKKLVVMLRDLLYLVDTKSTSVAESETNSKVTPDDGANLADDVANTFRQRILSVMPSPPYRNYELDMDIWNNRLRWEMNAEKATKLSEIADRHSVTREFVRQRELRLVSRLRKCQEICQLQTYLKHRLNASDLPVYLHSVSSAHDVPVPDLHTRWQFYSQVLKSLDGPYLFPEHSMDSLIAVSFSSFEQECEFLSEACSKLNLWILSGHLMTRSQVSDEVRLACQAAGFTGGRLFAAVDLMSGLILFAPSSTGDDVAFGIARYEDGTVKRPFMKQETFALMQKAAGRRLTPGEFYALSGRALSRLGLEPWSESFVAINSSRDIGTEFSSLDRDQLKAIADLAVELMKKVSRVGWTYESLLREMKVDESTLMLQPLSSDDLRSALRIFASEELCWAQGKRFCLASRRAQMISFRDEVRQLVEQAGGPMHVDEIRRCVIDNGVNDWIQIIPKLPVVKLGGRRYGLFPRDLNIAPHEISNVQEFVREVVDYLRRNGNSIDLARLLDSPHIYGIERTPECLATKMPSEVHEVIQALSPGTVRIGDTITFESNSRNGGSWQDRYDALLFYIREYGSPPPSMENGTPNPLYRWLAVQKMKMRSLELSDEQVALLREIGVSESVSHSRLGRDSWMDRYRDLTEYLKQNNGGWPPSQLNGKSHPLYQWMAIQRRKKRQSELSTEQIALLNKIGFVW